VPIECIALGLFAVPELIEMAIARTNTGSIQQLHGLFHEQMRGVRDVLRNWKLVLNSATLGVVLGSVPGMGAAVIDWIAYGSAARMIKGASESFGKGDVRGLIAAESANCSREGGALIPTLAFGVPGAPSMALLLGAFLSHGIAPGPKLLDTQLDITYTLVWSLALANVVGAGICFLCANPLARIATLRAGILIPIVLAVCFVGAYQGSKSYGDLVVLVAFGLLGWTMKRYGWARAPLILGFVLGKLIEKYLFISIGRYQFEWLQRPGVIAIFGLTVLVLLWPLGAAFYRQWKPAVAAAPPNAAVRVAVAERSIDDIVRPALWIVAFLGFAAAFWGAADWRLSARLMPQTAATTGLIVVACAAIMALAAKRQHQSPAIWTSAEKLDSGAELSAKTVYGRFFVELLWLLGFLAAVWLIGLMPSMGLYVVLYMSTAGKTPWPTALIITASLWIGFYFLFAKLLHVPWPSSLLGDAFPDLREWTGRLI
jgi:hypothetical protein